MRLTSFTDFGLRMRMAGDPLRGFSSAELSAELGLSRNHLAKIIQHMARAGLIDTRRGGGGGAVLARPSSAIRLGEILLGEIRRLAEAAFLAELDRATLADIALTPLAGARGPLGVAQ